MYVGAASPREGRNRNPQKLARFEDAEMQGGFRSSVVWISLLGAIEAMDILTTDIGRAYGAVESMPISAAVMNRTLAVRAAIAAMIGSGLGR